MTIRSIHLAAVLLFLLANLLVALFVLPSSALGEQDPEPVPATYLFTYPRGPSPELISDLHPGVSGLRNYGGIVTIPVTEEIYFYDLDFDNIKVIDPTNGSLLRLIDGPHDYGGQFCHAWDMAVAPDGSITVLISCEGGRTLDFRRLSPSDTSWTQVLRLAVSALPNIEPAGGAYHLDTAPDGAVYVFFYRNRRSVSVDTLARLVSESQLSEVWNHATSGIVGANGFFYESWIQHGPEAEELVTVRDRNGALIRSFPGTQGLPIGVSQHGFLGLYGWRIAVIDPQGEIVSVCRHPDTKGKPDRMLGGRSDGAPAWPTPMETGTPRRSS